jgi:uncharacterized protein YebE (UPF0316 family)
VDPVIYDWILLPGLILVARIGETSLKTVRQVYVAKGLKRLAAGIGTGEVAVWLLSTGVVITHLTNIMCIVAYIAGYAIGTMSGIDLENNLKVGTVIVRIITRKNHEPMMLDLREKGYGITRLDGTGSYGSAVSVLLVLVPRSELDQLVRVLDENYPDAIFSIEDVRTVKGNAPIFYREQPQSLFRWLQR